ncbi:hypothetical protein LguiA_035181 [Lonicera macranthoides]
MPLPDIPNFTPSRNNATRGTCRCFLPKSVLLPLRLQAVDKCLSFRMFPHSLPPRAHSPTKEKNKMVEIQEQMSIAAELPATVMNKGSTESKPTTDSTRILVSNSNQVTEERKPAAVIAALPPTPAISIVPQTTPLPPPNFPSNAVASPPPPPTLPSKGAEPPPPMPLANRGAPPPPPPVGASKALRPMKANTKLRRSTQMGNLYRRLKGKVEGSTLTSKRSQGRDSGRGIWCRKTGNG